MTSAIPKYLSKELKKIATKAGFTNYSFKETSGSNRGDGFVAKIISVTIRGTRKANQQLDELHLICKILPSSKICREAISAEQLFVREATMYSEILPALVQFQREKCLTKDSGFFVFPKSYFTIADYKTNRFAIVLEDIRSSGFTMLNKQTPPIGYEHIKLLMMELGKLHGLSFVLRDQRPELFNRLRQFNDLFLVMDETSALTGNVMNSTYDYCYGLLEGKEKERDWLAFIKQNRKQCMQECLGRDVAEPFSVLGHGDCWINNVMYKTAQQDSPTEICILDWQLSRFGSPVLDINYFLLSATEKEMRDKHFQDFIQIYYTSLSNICTKCGSNAEHLFSFENLQQQFRKFGKFGLIVAPGMLQMTMAKNENITSVEELLSESDGKLCSLGTFDHDTEIKYKERIGDVIMDSYKYGWIV